MAKGDALTPRELDFVREYLIDLHGTKAYRRAFPHVKESTARTNAAKLLAKASILAAITVEREKTANKLELTREAVIAQYQRIGFSDPRKLFDAYGQIKPIHELDDDAAAAVQGVELDYQKQPDGEFTPVLKIKLADRKSALDSIMKAQGWNSAEKHEHTGKNGGAIETLTRVVLVPPKEKAQVNKRPISRDGED